MAEMTFQQKTKTMAKLIDNGIISEKDLQNLNFDSVLQIPGITMQDLAVVSQLQKHTKDNKLYSYLSGGERNAYTVRDVPARYVCRYIDDSHFEYGPNLRHICEFAEMIEDLGYKVVPLRASLPEKAYVYIESDNKIGVVTKGEMGYKEMDITFSDKQDALDMVDINSKKHGITKAQSEAMKCGSMFGWHVPAADPKNYEENGIPKNFRARDTAR